MELIGTALVVGLVLGVVIAVGIMVFKARANKRDEVVMAWEGLRFTRTELIEGYGQNAPRQPLEGSGGAGGRHLVPPWRSQPAPNPRDR
jgi:hypothetical protein